MSTDLASLLAQLQQTTNQTQLQTQTQTQTNVSINSAALSGLLGVFNQQQLQSQPQFNQLNQLNQSQIDVDLSIPQLAALPQSLAFSLAQQPLQPQPQPPPTLSFPGNPTLPSSFTGYNQDPPPPPRPSKFSPSILRSLADIAENPRVLATLRTLKFAQSQKEASLADQRSRILERHAKQRDQAHADEIMGKKVDTKAMEAMFQRDLREWEKYLSKEMAEMLKKQQIELEDLKIPFFWQTTNPTELALQKRVLDILIDCI
ncbi:hypothetical protein BCR33DRAFT_715354 [Rhizoclosmatium globosum]|uniref:Uncharacterized protein n=1 Tax=Rhizoclosmatium globosum TaxID=329046 RepID=A0A1Y2CIU5_9FUNG|nr:hypothetical protein BCR33DRAFT_715354 [Rhizoclosmatium globosum]|eukprot:ORY46961.1 hypothetical protein BCR33DRAFT_715354 [Rhizoclosmatium globosum]